MDIKTYVVNPFGIDKVSVILTPLNQLADKLNAPSTPGTSGQVLLSDGQGGTEWGEASSGLTEDVKQALLDCFQHVAWIDEDGQEYYDALYDALYPPVHATSITLNKTALSFTAIGQTQTLVATVLPSDATDTVVWSSSDDTVATVANGVVTTVAYGNATITATAGSVSATCSVVVAQATLTSISAVYTQSGTVYDTDSLDSLKSDLVVTATWSDSTTSTVAANDYTLSGTLTEGTSIITVSYGGQTTSFTVTVTRSEYTLLYTISGSDLTLCGGLVTTYRSATGGYYAAGSTNAAYVGFDLTCEANATYKIEMQAEDDVQLKVYTNAVGTATKATNQETITQTDNGNVTLPFVAINPVPGTGRFESVRFTATKTDGTDMQLSDVTNIKIYKKEPEASSFDPEYWATGYVAGTGGITATGTNGEMYSRILIPVTEGHTYRIANTDSAWTTNWAAWVFYQDDLSTRTARSTATATADHVDVTVPTGYSYLLFSSRNMASYYTTATITDITE